VDLYSTYRLKNLFFFFWYSAVPTAGQWLLSLGRRWDKHNRK